MSLDKRMDSLERRWQWQWHRRKRAISAWKRHCSDKGFSKLKMLLLATSGRHLKMKDTANTELITNLKSSTNFLPNKEPSPKTVSTCKLADPTPTWPTASSPTLNLAMVASPLRTVSPTVDQSSQPRPPKFSLGPRRPWTNTAETLWKKIDWLTKRIRK